MTSFYFPAEAIVLAFAAQFVAVADVKDAFCDRFAWPNYPPVCLTVEEGVPITITGRRVNNGGNDHYVPLLTARSSTGLVAGRATPRHNQADLDGSTPVSSLLADDGADRTQVVTVWRGGKATLYRVPAVENP